jgi:hypothetical protein
VALVNGQEPLNQYDFSAGINISEPGHLIGDNECYANIQTYDGTRNCYWNVGIRKRLGTVKVNATPLTGKLVNGIRFYRSATPVATTVVSSAYPAETKIFYLDGTNAFQEIASGSGTAIATGADVYFAKWKDSLYVSSGSTGNAVIQKITYSAGWVRSNITGFTYKPQFLCFHKDRLWAAGGDLPQGQLWCSSYDNDTEWGSAGTSAIFNVGYQDGDPITALVPLGNDLIIYKNNSVWAMVGDNTENWYQQKRIDNTGCVAPKSVVNIIGLGHIFLGSDNLYFYDGTTLTAIGNTIRPWLDNIPLSLRKHCASTYYNNYFRIAFPSLDMNSANNKELLLDLKYFKAGKISWWLYDGRNVAAYVPYSGPQDTNILAFCDDLLGHLRQADIGTQDDSTDFVMELHSKYFVFDQPNTEKNYDRLKIDHALGVGNLNLSIIKNLNDEFTLPLTIDTAGGGGTTLGNMTLGVSQWSSQNNSRMTTEVALPSECDGYALAYKVSHNTNYANVSWYGATLNYKYKRF